MELINVLCEGSNLAHPTLIGALSVACFVYTYSLSLGSSPKRMYIYVSCQETMTKQRWIQQLLGNLHWLIVCIRNPFDKLLGKKTATIEVDKKVVGGGFVD